MYGNGNGKKDKLTLSNETAKPVGKADSSKTDGLISAKSNKSQKTSRTVFKHDVLSKDVSRSNRLGESASPPKLPNRLSKAAERPTSTDSKQHAILSKGHEDRSPIVKGIDKLHFSVPVIDLQLERAIEVALQLVKKKKLPLKHRSIKGDWFRHKFVYTFGSHIPRKPCQAVIKMKPTNPKAKVELEIDLNPNHLTEDDVREFIHLWKELFSVHARELAKQVGIMRIDINADCPYRTDDLIIDMDGAMVGQKYFVKTNRGAELQSNYSGSAKSNERVLMYDKNSQEEFMQASTRNVVDQQEAHEDDALIHLMKGRSVERTRVEMRRLFKTPHPLVSELTSITDPFGKVHVYQVNFLKAKNISIEFIAYLDCVRVRGVIGAGRYLLKKCGGTKEAKQKVQDFENKLARIAAPWWQADDFKESVLDLLKVTPLWRFLKPPNRH